MAISTGTMVQRQRTPWYNILYIQVLIAIVLGVILGNFWPETGVAMKPLGDVFINAIRMLIAPIIFCTVVHGIAGMEDMKRVGRVGGKALLYFEVMTTVALAVGLIIVNVISPGSGIHATAATWNNGLSAADMKDLAHFQAEAGQASWITTLTHIVPSSVVGAFATGEVVQVLFFAILFAFALQGLGPYSKPVLTVIDVTSAALFRVIGIVMRAAPLGAFGAMAFTIGKFGISSLFRLGLLMGSVYLTCLFFILVVLGIVTRLCGFSILRFISYIKDELLLVLGTSSSESALPRLMAKLRNLGCDDAVVGLTIPTGYSFNLDGTCIYLTMAALFLAQATDTSLTLTEQIGILAVLLVTSKGAAGVTGSGFIVLAATLGSTGIPVASIALILGIDRFMSEARALTNLIGNGVATVVVAKWENALDETRMRAVLAGEAVEMLETPVPAATHA